MQLSPADLEILSTCAIEAATKAGQMIAAYPHRDLQVQHKAGGNTIASQVLTEVDLRSEAIIVKELQPTCACYDLALLTEESEDDKNRFHKDYFWCVDPMDGTLSFIESQPGYAVSIALVSREGEALIGVVYDPVTQVLYSAVKGQKVQRQGKDWLVHAVDSHSVLTLICDRGFMSNEKFTEVTRELDGVVRGLGYAGLTTMERNGAVLNACAVLEQPPAVYFKFPKPQAGGGSLWDFAATAAIFQQLGFSACDFYGERLDLNRKDSTFMNHRGVIYVMDSRLLKPVRDLLTLYKGS
ncbi:MAG: inositol monophosphatase [Gammaproteobacteria bacterium]|nr:inositol monophosphatase [Gammaproteobacteria bacterium]MDH5801639.1 inositol monophosphatase [Gammaproteobacteria bacterium]